MSNDEITTGDIMEFLQEHMVTKQEQRENLQRLRLDILDAMDDKIGALKGDMTIMMRGEDKKLTALTDLLRSKRVIEEQEAQTLLALQPFPQK